MIPECELAGESDDIYLKFNWNVIEESEPDSRTTSSSQEPPEVIAPLADKKAALILEPDKDYLIEVSVFNIHHMSEESEENVKIFIPKSGIYI